MSVTNVTPRNILAPTDFSDISNAATAYAAHLAMALKASLHVQHVIPVGTHGRWKRHRYQGCSSSKNKTPVKS